MNYDNMRLREIQMFKSVYHHELDKCDSIRDCILIQDKIDELDKEEKEILDRFKVEL